MRHGWARTLPPALHGTLAAALLLAMAAAPTAILHADERILEFHSAVDIHSDGSMSVTETITVQSEVKNIRRGIYRDFPTQYEDRFGNHYRVDFTVIGVKRDGRDEPWHSENRSNGIRIYAGSANRFLNPGRYEYEFSYRTNRQIGFFDDHDELWWNVTGNGWRFPIDRASATVSLPGGVPSDVMQVDAWTGGFGSEEKGSALPLGESPGAEFRSPRPLAAREGLTVLVTFPKGLVDEPDFIQRLNWFLDDNGSALALLIGFFAVLAWYLYAWQRVGRDPPKGVVIPRFEPPEGLSPAACSYVRSMSLRRSAFVAAIISLAVKKQLLIREEGDSFSLERIEDPGHASPTPGEQSVLNSLLPGRHSAIELDNANHSAFQAAKSALSKALKREHKGRLFNLNGTWVWPGVLASLLAVVISVFLEGGLALRIVYAVLVIALHLLFIFLLRAPTVAGRAIMDEIEGFRMYLDTAEQDRLDRMRSPALTPEVFEAFLPYAYALGVENNWCDRFAREMPEELRRNDTYHPGWYYGNRSGLSALHHVGHGFSSEFSSAISSASSPPGSSSGSGGGGFSGGGGGGGGGGGW